MKKPVAESSDSCFETRKQRYYLRLFIVAKALWDSRPFKTKPFERMDICFEQISQAIRTDAIFFERVSQPVRMDGNFF